jgi:hypothetical protein
MRADDDADEEQTFADVFEGLSLTSRRGRRRRRTQDREPSREISSGPDRRKERRPRPAARSGDLIDWPRAHDEEFDEEENASVVRAYAWTGGRTSSEYPLEIETLVSTSEHARDVAKTLKDEYQSVAKLCQEPKSVAEVGAMLALPLGVIRVLLGDMARHGLIVIHRTAASNDDHVPDLDLFQRVLNGLRNLSPSR